jgi:3'-phosphoadenosine 5'-phosphosulfate sulfotransferase (PAPS reductase)/FAD synthetase
MYSDVPAVFVNTGLEYPEIQKFAMSQPNVTTVRPEMRFDQVVKEYGYPVVSKTISKKVGTVARNGKDCKTYQFFTGKAKTKSGKPSKFNCKKWAFLCDAPFKVDYFCCEIMKKQPFRSYEEITGRKPIAAVMACESDTREAVWMKTGCNAFDGKNPISNPLSFWTEQDILHYIKEYDVPYCSVYGDIQVKQEKEFTDQVNLIDYLGCYEPEDTLETTGCKRTGCIFCMYGCHLEKEPNRFQRLKETHPRQYDFCINGGEMVDGKWQPNKKGLGLGHVLDYIGVKYD